MPTSLILTCPATARIRTVARTGAHHRGPFCRWQSGRHDVNTRFPAALERRVGMFAASSACRRPSAPPVSRCLVTPATWHTIKRGSNAVGRAPAALTTTPKASMRRRDVASLSLHNTNKSLKAARGRYWIHTPEERMNDRDEFLRDRLGPQQPGTRAAHPPAAVDSPRNHM